MPMMLPPVTARPASAAAARHRWQPVFAATPAEPIEKIAGRIRKDTEALLKYNRNSFNPDGLAEASTHIAKTWQGLGYPVRFQNVIFPATARKTMPTSQTGYRNVLASYGPKDAPRIVIGAHYDVVGDNPGADDNTSSVAALTEIMRRLATLKPKVNHRIDFVAYTLEEEGLHGSMKHARKLVESGVPVKGMISLEMLGYYDNRPDSQRYPNSLQPMAHLLPKQGNFLAVVGSSKPWADSIAGHIQNAGVPSLPFAPIPVELVDAMRSDHGSYIQHDIPSVMITDTANFRNPNYHKPTDTIDTLNFPNIAKAVNGVYTLLTSTP